MLSVYQYSSAHHFLRDSWEEKRKMNPKFSLRSWSKNLGLIDHGYLHRVINGKKKVTKKYVPLFIKSLELNTKEGLYFDTLVDYERAKTIEEKQIYQDRLIELSPSKPLKIYEVEAFKFLKDPLHLLLLEMTELKEFKNDPKWIKERIRIKCTQNEISSALERLISLGLLAEESDGTLTKTQKHLSNVVDVVNRGVQEYHKNISKLAAEMISEQDIMKREYNSHTINIDYEKIPLAKDLIRDFIKEFIAKVESPSKKGTTTYQLNTQLFELTKIKNQENKNENY